NLFSTDVWVHVKKIRDLVEHLYDRMAKIQANAVRINSIMNTWGTTPLINRKDGKKEALVSLEDRKERVQKRYNEIRQAGEEAHALLEENRKLFFDVPVPKENIEQEEVKEEDMEGGGEEKEEEEDGEQGEAAQEPALEEIPLELQEEFAPPSVEPSDEIKKPPEKEPELEPVDETEIMARLERMRVYKEPMWLNYVDFIDDVISEGLFNTIMCSMMFFMNEMDPELHRPPVFEIQLHLQEQELVFKPSVIIEDPGGFFLLLITVMLEVLRMATLVPRVTKGSKHPDYMVHCFSGNVEGYRSPMCQ
ncbi:unnamed protein product, partial [Timema podura]|nr:unnamed protein product [Timema podura]